MASFQISAIFRPPLVMWMIVSVIIITACDVASSTSLDSTALLNLKKSFTANNALVSWTPKSDPCSSQPSLWTGIICDDRGSVIGIRLENIGLSGTIDIDSLLQLPSLRTISFVNNSFSGLIPDFNRLVNLKTVQLSGNHFSGSIPPNFFDKMVGLKKLWLSYNNFTGGIPPSFGKLSNLEELRLENNGFSGEIPPMELPYLMILALQNNDLQGEIPESLLRFGQNAFLGNPGLCGAHTPLLCNSNSNNIGLAGAPDGGNNFSDASNHANQPRRLKLGMMTAVALVFGLLGIGIIISRYNQQQTKGKSSSIPLTMQDSNCWSGKKIGSRGGVSSIKGGGVDNLVLVNQDKGVFGMLDLMRAGAEVMGHGLLGSTYKAMMGNGLKVVVKRVKEMNKVERGGFDDEMSRLGKLRHPNLLPLLGYQYRAEEKLIVSEFVEQGNLTCLLDNDPATFDWPARLKVVQGIARGLAYLQSELKSSSDVPHGNLKSSNVLIGPDFEPLLVDYGFNTLLEQNQASEALSSYKSPEASTTHKVSSKSDVYCLGIIILEILTGKNLSQSDNIDEIREQDVIDSELLGKTKNSKGEMVKLFRIGVNCTNSDPNQRLDLDEAVNKITNVQVEGDDLQQPQVEIVVREEHDESVPHDEIR